MTAGTVIVLGLQGRLTSVLHPCATALKVLTRIQAGKPSVILDLRAVPSVDASGVGLIAALYRQARERGGDLMLVGLQERPRRLLAICGLLRFLQTFKTEEDALQSIVTRGGPELYLERPPLCLREPCWSPPGLGTPAKGDDVASDRSGRMMV